MCVCFFLFFSLNIVFIYIVLSYSFILFQCNGGVKNLVLRLISAIWSLWFSFVLALNFSVILNVQVLSSVCT